MSMLCAKILTVWLSIEICVKKIESQNVSGAKITEI